MVERAPASFNFATDVVERWAHVRPDDPALWCVNLRGGASDQKFNFKQMAALLRRAAHFFVESGIGPGDRVMVILPRIPQWWIVMLGLIKLGAIPIPGTTLLTARDIQYRLQAAEAKAVVTDQENVAKISNFDGIKIQASGTVDLSWLDFDAGLREVSGDYEAEPTPSDAPGIIYFTSGTTGHPKMVLHSQASYGLAHRLTAHWWLDLKPEDIHWNLADTGWAKAAWSSFFGPWHMGACIFSADLRGKFDPREALRILARYPITTFCAPPTALRLFVREDLSAFKFPRLRHCVSAGEPLNPEVMEIWKRVTGLDIYEGYGQTETIVVIGTFRQRGDHVRPGVLGRPMPGYDVALLDAEGKEVPVGEEGEIAIRVRPERPLGLFLEYWKNPEENAARFKGDWYLTGDCATRDAEGFYSFVGRGDDLIKSAGYRIGPFEVESALVEHDSVVEAAVVGVPDPLRGQLVKAFVVLKAGTTATDALKLELQEHCKQVTAPYKYPREIEFVTELPKTISGKIRRLELRQRV